MATIAGIRAYEHFPTCLGVIPDGPSHRFADPVRHRPAMTIAMLTIGSSAAAPAGIYAGIYGFRDGYGLIGRTRGNLG